MLRTLTFAALALALTQTEAARADGPMVGHMVYFKLKESTESNQDKLVAACKKYLSGHPGTVFFAAGKRGKQFDREVNTKDWDVALHLVFEDQKAHDRYQAAKLHLQFIEENKELWGGVEVFDSLIDEGDVKGKP